MKKILIMICASMFVLIGSGLVYAANSDVEELEKTHPAERQMEWFCPWCGIGPDNQAGTHGMHGKSMQKNMGQQGPYCQMRQFKQPVSEQEAKRLMENYAAGNPNLKLGEVREKDNSFVGNVVTKDGSLVEKLVIDRKTGWMRVEY